MKIDHTMQNQLCDKFTENVDLGSINPTGRVLIYDNSNKDTLLATINLNNPSYVAAGTPVGSQPGIPGNAYVNITTIPEDPTPSANGVAGYAEIENRSQSWLAQGNVGLLGSGAMIELNSLTISTSIPAQIIGGGIIMPEGSI